MFEDSLVESSGRLGKDGKRGWTTAGSFLLQMLLIGVMILIPLIYTEALPKASLTTFLVAPPPPPPPPPPAPATPTVVKKITTDIVDGALRTPTKIPEKVAKIVEDEAPPVSGAVVGGVPGGVPGGQSGGVLGGVLSAANATPPKIAAPQKVRISSGVATGNLINKVQPQYPMIAKQARITGAVVLQATISKGGNIENLKVVSGHPMLINAAMDAVRQWRYRPYLLNGEPVEVETQVTVNFTMGG
jgi:protein TonB